MSEQAISLHLKTSPEQVVDVRRTKLLSSDGKRFDHLFAAYDFKEVLSPLIEPETKVDQAAIDGLLLDLGCLSNRPTANAKFRVLLSSFIMQAQRLSANVQRKGGEMIIGWPHDEAYWRVRSKVGYRVAKVLREALIERGWMTHHAGATINLYHGFSNCNGYLIADFVPSKADGISFQSSDLVYATKTSALQTRVKDDAVDQRTKALWAIWKKTPLTYDNQKMWLACRSFSNADLTRGGRLYGRLTTMRQSERLKCRIDGKPVAEVDVSGMYPTLLCSIVGQVPFAANFTDPYDIEGVNREEVKAVVGSAIGGGTHLQRQPTAMITRAGIDQQRLSEIRKIIIPRFECLKALKRGILDSEALAIHETEIMMRVVERLRQPIFILHDCLICQQDEALNVGMQLQREYVSYCLEQGWTPIAPAFSIEQEGQGKRLVSGEVNPRI